MIRPEPNQIFAVIGNPVKHSLSPAMMNAAFREMGYPAVYVALYVDDPAEDLEILHDMGIAGLSVTLPHKELALQLASDADETAKAIGAVNTLRRSRNGWQGRNTDWVGANRALEQAGQVEGVEALVLGAGGAARAVAFGLTRRGARVTVSNRGVERGKMLARTFGSDFIPLAWLERSEKIFDIVVQCTPVGLEGGEDSVLVPVSFFRPEMVVMDVVYRPRRTGFSLAAEEAGCTVVSGLEMLLFQGIAQLEFWLGRPVEKTVAAVMREALMGAVPEDE